MVTKQGGVGQRAAAKLLSYLRVVVAVNVAVAAGPDKVAHLHIALLCHHMRQQCVAGNVKWHTQKYVGTALLHLMACWKTARIQRPV